MKMENDCSTKNDNLEERILRAEDIYANRGLIIDIARNMGWNYHDCEELVQMIMIKCWDKNSMRYDPRRGKLTTYLARIARNMACDMMRKAKHNPIPTEDIELISKIEEEAAEIYDEKLDTKQQMMLERGIKELYRIYPSKKANDAFVMFFRKGMKANQIAEILETGENFVNVSVHRGTARLKEIIQKMIAEEELADAC